MQFGWLTLALSPSPAEDAQRIEQLIEQACAAERLGFADVWLTEHYFTGESVYNDSLMFAAALAMKTEKVRIGFAVVQTPFHHPVRLAVQLALLDNLSKGRIDVGIGKGTVYNEYEFVGHGLRSTDSRERMEEAVDIIERAWREAPLTYDGKFHKIRIPAIRPKPVQQPGPPLWRSVISPGSFKQCGQLGVGNEMKPTSKVIARNGLGLPAARDTHALQDVLTLCGKRPAAGRERNSRKFLL